MILKKKNKKTIISRQIIFHSIPSWKTGMNENSKSVNEQHMGDKRGLKLFMAKDPSFENRINDAWFACLSLRMARKNKKKRKTGDK